MFSDELLYINNLKISNIDNNETYINILKDKNTNINLFKDTLFKLLTKEGQPNKIDTYKSSLPYIKYLIDNNLKSGCMYDMLPVHLEQGIGGMIFTLYNNNYKDTRKIINHLNSLKGDDRIPYLKFFIKNLSIFLGKGELVTKDFLLFIFESITKFKMILNMVKTKFGYINKIAGEVKCDINFYNDIDKFINIDYDYISNAEIGLDLGGGFMTPSLSKIFNKKLYCLDIAAIDDYEERINYLNIPKEHLSKLKEVEYIKFDCIYDELPDTHDSYFISSFGFINSTTSPSTSLLKINPNMTKEFIAYKAVEKISNLIKKEKSVYCVFWGRPTTRVNHNKLCVFKFEEGYLKEYEILSDISKLNLEADGVTDPKFGKDYEIEFIEG